LPNRYQKSTARDMATLARALIRDFPKHYHFFSATKFSYGKRTYSNHNALLRSYQGTDGIKTGYIRASGFNLVASAERGGRRLIVVVFGGKSSRSRDAHAADLLNRGFTRLAQAVPSPPGPPRRNPFQLAALPAAATPVAATPAVITLRTQSLRTRRPRRRR
jgi:D-alanyl-D-alanine carboxypeptidase